MYKIFFIIYVFIAFSVYSDEIVISIKYNGLAPIAINGDLSDWDTVDIPKCSIENPISEKPKSNNDISAYFKEVSDNNNYYYGINVSDDIVTIDNPNYKYLYDKDCVEILLNNNLFNGNPIKIWISLDNTGRTLVDGRDTAGYSYPYIWHSYGVVAAIQQTKQGYCVEVLIPKEMLSYFGNTSSDIFTNHNVYDYDKDGIPKKVLQWKSGILKNNYGRIVFDKTIDMIQDNSFNNNLVLNIESMSNSTPETSLAIAKAYQRAGKYKESNEILRKTLDDSNGKDKDIVKSEMIYNFYKLNDLKNVYALYNEIINNNGEVTSTVFNILYNIEIKKYEYLSDVFPVTEENYKSRSIINLHWGSNVDQIAYIENVYNGTDGGPSSFDIDNQGNIYIVDGGNEAVKIYNYNGKFVRTFPIAANYYPRLYLSLGINSEIWIHESEMKCFRVYSDHGKLLKTIEYNMPIPSNFEIRNNEIVAEISKICNIRKTAKKGIADEDVYIADNIRFDSKYPTMQNSGKYSKKVYNVSEREYSPKDGLKLPKVFISDERNTKQHFINGFMPIYEAIFMGEDKFNNYYLILYTHIGGFRCHIVKYDKSSNLVSLIINVPISEYYEVTKKWKIDENGNIYILYPTKEMVQVILYENVLKK